MLPLLGLVLLCFIAGSLPSHAGPVLRVALRYDDYEPYSPVGTVEPQMINILRRNRVPLTIAVVPSYLPESTVLTQSCSFTQAAVDFIKPSMDEGLIEVAVHGLNHRLNAYGLGEFGSLPADAQLARVTRGKAILEQTFGVPMRTWIPPWNQYDMNTVRAMAALGFTGVSGVVDSTSWNSTYNFLRPAHTTTTLANLRANIELWRQHPSPDCCMVCLYHQRDFKDDPQYATTGTTTFAEFDLLTAWLASQPDLEMVTMRTITDGLPRATSQSCADPMDRGLVARWNFDDPAIVTDNVPDITGNGHTGYAGSGTRRTDGLASSGALQFDSGGGMLVNAPEDLELPNANRTFTAWIRPEMSGLPMGVLSTRFKGRPQLYLDASGQLTAAYGNRVVTTAPVPIDGGWHEICWVVQAMPQPDQERWTIYVDGRGAKPVEFQTGQTSPPATAGPRGFMLIPNWHVWPDSTSVHALPGRIEAEGFDFGKEGDAYHDTTVKNSYNWWGRCNINVTGYYDVDIKPGPPTVVSMDADGEWMRYTLSVPRSGVQRLVLRASNAGNTSSWIKVLFDDVEKAALQITPTGGADNYVEFGTDVMLDAGWQRMKVLVAGPRVNLDWIESRAKVPTYGNDGQLWSVPGRIEAENFDSGSEGAGDYRQASGVNFNNAYRTAPVRLSGSSPLCVGPTTSTEWLQYSIESSTAQNYRVVVRASNGNTTACHWRMSVDGVAGSGWIDAGPTGSWDSFLASSTQVRLAPGPHVVKFEFDGALNVDRMEFLGLDEPLFAIGQASGLTGVGPYVGAMDDIRVYNRALSSSGTAPVPVTGALKSPYDFWIGMAGLPSNQVGPEQTPYGDGVTNLQKFAFNLDPTKADIRQLVAGSGGTVGLPVVTEGSNRRLRLEFIRRKASGNPGIIYRAEFSSDLTNWVDLTGLAEIVSIDSVWERLVVDDVPPEGSDARYARVVVSQTAIGTGPLPAMVVEEPVGIGLIDGHSAVDFGATVIGIPKALTLTIKNTGTADLTGLGITKDGTDAAEFVVTASPSAPVAVGGTTTLTITFVPVSTGTRVAALHIASNDPTVTPFDLTLTGGGIAGGATFSEWLSDFRVPSNQAGGLQTPSGDGVPNLLKFAFNMDPTKPDTRRLTVGANGLAGMPGVTRSGGKLRIEFIRRKAATIPGVTYTPQFSSDLGSWSDFTGAPVSVTSIDSVWERVVVDDSPPAGATGRFGRVKVATAP